MATKGTSAVPPVGHSGPSAVKARLLEIAAKVRQVPGSFREDERNLGAKGWIAFGRLIPGLSAPRGLLGSTASR